MRNTNITERSRQISEHVASARRQPIMHASEYIGGRMAEYIRETPGYWVVDYTSDDTEPEGWAVAHKDA